MVHEMQIRQNEAQNYVFQTVYFGGGTPSLLSREELSFLTDAMQRFYRISDDAEWTIECNPEDIQPEYLRFLHDLGFNRISLGVQSFIQEDLLWMNRAHNATQAHYALECMAVGPIKNYSLDLIYGLPGSNSQKWFINLQQLDFYKVPHFSAYALTLEERTKLMQLHRKGELHPASDVDTVDQLFQLMDYAESAAYEHYEISNFAKLGYRSRHNSAYWEGLPYLGFGPSAHSYDGEQRRWNISNNALYTKIVLENKDYFETETLSPKEHYNEYIMLNLRKIDGIKGSIIEQRFPQFAKYFFDQIQLDVESGNVSASQGLFKLTKRGIAIADQVALNVFIA